MMAIGRKIFATALIAIALAGSAAAQIPGGGGLVVTGTPTSGNCPIANGTPNFAIWGSCGGAAVSSVFGRTGAVVAATNDYSIAQISGAGTAAADNTGTTGTTIPLNNGGFTQSGTANFSGIFEIGGMAETFPASGSIVGLTDTQTLTNKTISGGSNTISNVALSSLATQAANTVIGNGTGSTGGPTALSVPSCSAAVDALIWTSGTGFGCNASINAATLGGATFASPGQIGISTPGSAAVTALSASTTVAVTGTTTAPVAAGTLGFAGISTTPTFGANGEGDVWLSSTLGLVDGGKGSTNDRTFVNSAGTTWLDVPTGTTKAVFPNTGLGTISAGTLGGANTPWVFFNRNTASTFPNSNINNIGLQATDGANGGYLVSVSAGNPTNQFFRTDGTISSPTAVQSGELLGQLVFEGFNGTSYVDCNEIDVSTTQILTGTNNGTKITFLVCPTNSSTSVTALTLNGSGVQFNQNLLSNSGNILCSSAAPTISSGFGTGASVTANNGSCSFTINVGTGGTATSGVIAMNATAANGWNCPGVTDITTTSASVFLSKQTASTTTTITVGNFSDTASATAWTASDKLVLACFGN